MEDSAVRFDQVFHDNIELWNRSRLECVEGSSLSLVGVGADCEVLAGNGAEVTLACLRSAEDHKIPVRLRLDGIDPLNYADVRSLSTATDLQRVSFYHPVVADRLYRDDSKSEAAQTAWARMHREVVEAFCPDPGTIADARWLVYERRREMATNYTVEWYVLNGLMRPLGYGLKFGQPVIAWGAAILATIVFCLLYTSPSPRDRG